MSTDANDKKVKPGFYKCNSNSNLYLITKFRSGLRAEHIDLPTGKILIDDVSLYDSARWLTPVNPEEYLQQIQATLASTAEFIQQGRKRLGELEQAVQTTPLPAQAPEQTQTPEQTGFLSDLPFEQSEEIRKHLGGTEM